MGQHQDERGAQRSSGHSQRGERPLRELHCFECGKLGHISTRCPSRALYAEEREANIRTPEAARDTVCRFGYINEESVNDILLDTGHAQTLDNVHSKLVPPGRETGGEIIVRCAHGDEMRYPTAEVDIEIGERKFLVVAGVSETLPVSVLLG